MPVKEFVPFSSLLAPIGARRALVLSTCCWELSVPCSAHGPRTREGTDVGLHTMNKQQPVVGLLTAGSASALVTQKDQANGRKIKERKQGADVAAWPIVKSHSESARTAPKQQGCSATAGLGSM
jgi:hypothetical protein